MQSLKINEFKLEEMFSKKDETDKKRTSTFHKGYDTLLDLKENIQVDSIIDTL